MSIANNIFSLLNIYCSELNLLLELIQFTHWEVRMTADQSADC